MNRRAFLSAAATCSALSASAQHVVRAQTMPRFYEAARYSSERGGAAFLVARHGVILAEDYPAGAVDARWPIGAATRALAPLLAASLAGDRLLNLDEPAALTLGDWGAHPVKSAITIRALLNGTSGVAFRRGDAHDLATAIALEPGEAPGQRFADDPAIYVLFAEIARRKLEASRREADPARYLTSRTLSPIGCTPIGWTRRPDGAPRFDDGAAVSTRGWAAVGELIRRHGVWRAQELADPATLSEAMRGSFAEARAGMGLWLAAPARGARAPLPIDSDLWRAASPAPIDLAMAAGANGQRLFIAPSNGLVIVRHARAAASWSDAQFLTLLWRDL